MVWNISNTFNLLFFIVSFLCERKKIKTTKKKLILQRHVFSLYSLNNPSPPAVTLEAMHTCQSLSGLVKGGGACGGGHDMSEVIRSERARTEAVGVAPPPTPRYRSLCDSLSVSGGGGGPAQVLWLLRVSDWLSVLLQCGSTSVRLRRSCCHAAPIKTRRHMRRAEQQRVCRTGFKTPTGHTYGLVTF